MKCQECAEILERLRQAREACADATVNEMEAIRQRDAAQDHDADTEELLRRMTKLKDEGWARVAKLEAALWKATVCLRQREGWSDCTAIARCKNAALILDRALAHEEPGDG